MTLLNVRALLRLSLGSLFAMSVLCSVPAQYAEPGSEDAFGEEAVADVSWENSPEKKDLDELIATKKKEYRDQISKYFTNSKTIDIIKSYTNRRKELKFNNIKDNNVYYFKLFRIPGKEVDWSNYEQAPSPADKDTIVNDVYEAARERVIERLAPDTQKARIIREAEERFRLVSLNERVTLELRSGRGANAFIEDQPVRSINDERVQLGNRFVIKEDLSDEDQAKFYPDVNARVKSDYLNFALGKVDVEVESAIDEECRLNTPQAFIEANFIPDITKKTASLRTAKAEFWMPKNEFVKSIRSKLIDEYTAIKVTKELPEYLRGQGYKFVQTTDGKGMEWVTQEEYDMRNAPAVQQMHDPYGPPPGF